MREHAQGQGRSVLHCRPNRTLLAQTYRFNTGTKACLLFAPCEECLIVQTSPMSSDANVWTWLPLVFDVRMATRPFGKTPRRRELSIMIWLYFKNVIELVLICELADYGRGADARIEIVNRCLHGQT